MTKLEELARIIDPDAWHETLPTDGCGVYWALRRLKVRAQARAILTALRDDSGPLSRDVVRYLDHILQEAERD